MLRTTIRTVLTTAVAAVALVGGLLTAGPQAAKASTVIGDCGWSSLSLPFVAWSDFNIYFQAPGGNFEGTSSSWTLGGGAQVVAGNESYHVGGTSDNRSLSLPTPTSSATSPTMCVTALSPTFRMFMRNNGANGHTDGQLAVYLNFTGANGNPQQVKIAGLKGTTSWSLSQPVSFTQYITTALKTIGMAQVSFTIKPNDDHGNWQIDDFYVDPLKGY